MSGALAGIRVVDLTNALAGSSTTKVLGELGAEVIKIENPGTGDFTRTLVPWVFQTFNRNKRSVAVDLRREEGVAIVKSLATTADVFIQSMRPGAAAELGLGREVISALNPRLIYVSLSGFGPDGPSAHRKGVDAVVQAESGLAALQGGVLSGLSFVDTATGLALGQAILAALFKRERTGAVDNVTISLLETALYLGAVPLADYSVTERLPDPVSYARRFPNVGIYDAADGPFFIAAYWVPEWRAICELVDVPELAEDPRFATVELRSANLEDLREEMNRHFAKGERAKWVRELEARGIMAGVVKSQRDLLTDAQVEVLGTLEDIELTDGKVARFARTPYRFSDRHLSTLSAAPVLGSDTFDVLDLIGIGAEDRQRLVEAGVVAGAEPDSEGARDGRA